MIDLLKAVLTLRLVVITIVAAGALVALGVWSLSHGAADAGIALLVVVAACVTFAAAAVRSQMRGR